MATTRASKLISVTDFTTGTVFSISLKKIIKLIVTGSNTYVVYLAEDGLKKKRLVVEAATAIATASMSNDIALLQPITLLDGTIMYVNNERVISIDPSTIASTAFLRLDEDVRIHKKYEFSSPTAANFQTATDNMIAVTLIATSSRAALLRYINNQKIAIASSETTGCEVLYDTNRAEFAKLHINISLSALNTLVNAL